MRGTCALSPTGLIPWFSKTEENTYATLLHHPFLFKGKPMHAQEVVMVELPCVCELCDVCVVCEQRVSVRLCVCVWPAASLHETRPYLG